MKQQTANTGLFRLFFVLGFLLSSHCVLKAQSITSPSNSELVIQGATFVGGVNCDMVQCPKYSFDTLKAVVWDDQPTSPGSWTTHVFVEYNGTPFTVASISDARFPDVVIGDDLNFPGDVYIVAVIYTDFGGPVNTT